MSSSCHRTVLAATIILLTVSAALAQPSSLIVPGQSLGGVNLDMNSAQVRKVWGPPSRIQQPEASIEAWQYDRHRSTVFIGNGQVYLIQTISPKFATREGMKVGAPLADIVRVYGRPECQNALAGGFIYTYANRGLLVRVVNGVVRALSVVGTPVNC